MEACADYSLQFRGTKTEIFMLLKLLSLMDVEERQSESNYMKTPIKPTKDGTTYQISVGMCEFYVNALLGSIKEDISRRTGNPYNYPDFSYECAPQLFAYLFPKSTFDYYINYGELGCWDPDTLYAEYDGKRLRIAKIRDNDCEEKIIDAYKKINPPAEEEWIDYHDIDLTKYYDAICDELGLGSFDYRDESPEKGLFIALSGGLKSEKSCRDKYYEESFFDEEDLHIYLISEQIRKHDISITEYIRDFPFTEEEFQKLIQTTSESGFIEMTAFLLEEKNRRFSGNGNGI